MTQHRVIAAPEGVAARLGDLPIQFPGTEVVAWDGIGLPPRRDITVWVAHYTAAKDPENVKGVVSALPDLTHIQLLSAGAEHWVPYIPAHIMLTAGKTIHGGTTAELAVALLLAHVRSIPLFVRNTEAGVWEKGGTETLADRHVVVLGNGDIGSRVAATVSTFDARVTVAARTSRDGVVSIDDARTLAPQTDALVIALPHTPATRGVVDAGWLAALPDNAVVINVARGPILDNEALLKELTQGRLRAGLDVTDPEPLPAGHPLWSAPGLIVSAHSGGNTEGWERRGALLVADQIRRLEAGEPLRYEVTGGY